MWEFYGSLNLKRHRMNKRMVSFHVDADSPAKLLKYWGLSDTDYSVKELDRFYKTAMARALELFDKNRIKVTFFCVGDELDASSAARQMFKESSCAGHEIANHTYSHRFGLGGLGEDELCGEIERCSRAIEKAIGSRPKGFRSPGYDVNNAVIAALEKMGMEYDSSGFWSILNVGVKFYHRYFRKDKFIHSGFGDASFRLPHGPYYPSPLDWQKRSVSGTGDLVELPMPRTRALGLPFYNNFHLIVPSLYRNIAVETVDRSHFIYLIHLIEFTDLRDGIPKELNVHPNMNMFLDKKLRLLNETIGKIMRRYESIRTDEFVAEWRGNQPVAPRS